MKIDKFLLLIIALILLLSLATFWQFRNFKKFLSAVNLSKFEIPKFEITSPFKKEGIKEFVSEDGKLKVKYAADWIELSQTILEVLNKEMVKEGAEVLFYAQKMELEKSAFAFLVIQKVDFETDRNLEEFIEEIKKENEEREIKMEMIDLTIEDEEAIMETLISKKESGLIFHSKEKIILSENRGWIITVFTLKDSWAEFEKEAEEILRSLEFQRGV